jgi:serine protease inhibitor ecotin
MDNMVNNARCKTHKITTRQTLLQGLLLGGLAVSMSCQSTPAPEVSLGNTITATVIKQDADKPLNLDSFSSLLPQYPSPSASQTVHILTGAKLNNGDNYQLEVQIGLNMSVDCNTPRLMGEITALPLGDKHYYQVASLMQAPMIKLPCTPGEEVSFIQLGDTLSISYSQLDNAVFYLPLHAQLRYRLLQAQQEWTFSSH